MIYCGIKSYALVLEAGKRQLQQKLKMAQILSFAGAMKLKPGAGLNYENPAEHV